MNLSKIATVAFAIFAIGSMAEARRSCEGRECRSEGKFEAWGEVPICLDLAVIDTHLGPDWENLGVNTITSQKVAEFAVDSNVADGFKLTFSSAGGGRLNKIGGSGASAQHIDYLIDLDQVSGTLGAGTVEPGVMSGISLASPSELDFAGVAAEPTVDLTYDVNFSMNPKSLEAGTYTDIVTIQLAAL